MSDRIFSKDSESPQPADHHGVEQTQLQTALRRITDGENFERQSRIFDTALSAIKDFVYILDCDGRFQYANKPLLNLWGLTLDQAIGKNFFDLGYPADLAEKLHRQIRWVVETRKELSDEADYTSPAGAAGYYEYIFSPVMAADGTVEAVAGSTRDITQRKRRELNFTLLADMQKLLAPIASPMEILRSVGRLIAERLQLAHCLFVEINVPTDEATVLYDHHAPGQPSLVGVYRLEDFHTEQERNAMAAGEMVFIDDVDQMPRPSANAARFRALGIRSLANASYVADRTWKFVLSVQKRDPCAWTPEDAELLPALTARLYLRLERAFADERLKQAKEAAETANRSKDRFLAVLSHELRTPLTPILMAATELRSDERLPREVREELGMIERNVALEARLIDDLLDHTKIVNGKLTMRSQRCDAHSLIGLVAEMVRSDAEQKRIGIRLDLAASRSVLKGDPARLQQVFWNLLRNAVKFSGAGSSVRVRSFDGPSGPDDGESVFCMEVADEGVGFEPGMAELIFQPFEQGATGPRFGGLGLGLAIARGIVEIHGGRVYARSGGPGQGAVFTVELPAAGRRGDTDGTLAAVENMAETEAAGDAPPMRLLLVEDHEPTMQVLKRLLMRAGHGIVTAATVEQARAAAAGEAFDLVISDLGLPDGTGIELMRHLRDAHGLRGIALSGYGTEEDLLRSGEAGFVEHLVKPVDFSDLRRVLRDVAPIVKAPDGT